MLIYLLACIERVGSHSVIQRTGCSATNLHIHSIQLWSSHRMFLILQTSHIFVNSLQIVIYFHFYIQNTWDIVYLSWELFLCLKLEHWVFWRHTSSQHCMLFTYKLLTHTVLSSGNIAHPQQDDHSRRVHSFPRSSTRLAWMRLPFPPHIPHLHILYCSVSWPSRHTKLCNITLMFLLYTLHLAVFLYVQTSFLVYKLKRMKVNTAWGLKDCKVREKVLHPYDPLTLTL